MKRLNQMIAELKAGGLCMKMKYAAKGRKEADK